MQAERIQDTRTEGRAAMSDGGAEAGWRSHTFADGVRSLTLLGPLDVQLAGRLWTRVSELIARGSRRLIVDASRIEPTGNQPSLLAAVFAGRPASYQAVVVAPPGSALSDLLPSSVGVTLSLTDAHRQLQEGILRQEPRRPPVRRPPAAPAGRLPTEERHALAVRQSLRWAQRAAREGDYERALAWLQMVEYIEGRLPAEWRRTREAWKDDWAAQVAGPRRVRPARR